MPRRCSDTERRLALRFAAILVFAATGPHHALAQPGATTSAPASVRTDEPLSLRTHGTELEDGAFLDVVADLDDDDADGTPDGRAGARVPAADLVAFTLVPGSHGATLTLDGPLRFVREGRPTTSPIHVARGRAAELAIQGTDGPALGTLHVQHGDEHRTVHVRIHRVELIDAQGRALAAERDSPRLSTRSPDIPLASPSSPRGSDADDLFLRVASPIPPEGATTNAGGPRESGMRPVRAELGTRQRLGSDTPPLSLRLDEESPGVTRSPWLRLYADAIDVALPSRAGSLLRASLGDVLEARVEAPTGVLAQSIRIGRPSRETGEEASRMASLRFVVLRVRPGGPPAIGRDEREARTLVMAQLELARAIFAPCAVELGDRSAPEVLFRAPPPPYALVVAEEDGFPARGGGEIRLRANGHSIGPIPTSFGDSPRATAERIASALRAAGLAAEVHEVPRTTNGSGPAADVLVRDVRGEPAFLEPDGAAPITTDTTQRVRVVDPSPFPSLRAFRNTDGVPGTAEERALVRALRDADPRTIDVIFVPEFDRPNRHGEAFLVGDAGPLAGTVLVARIGVARMATAYSLAHELAHVLLDEPYHLDDRGEPDPTRLLGIGPPRGDFRGPRRISRDECRTLRARSGPDGHRLLLAPSP